MASALLRRQPGAPPEGHELCQPGQLPLGRVLSRRGEAVVPPALVVFLRIPPLVELDDQALFQQPLDRRLQSARIELRPAARSLCDLLHDAVAVAVGVGQGDQDVEGGGGKGEQALRVFMA